MNHFTNSALLSAAFSLVTAVLVLFKNAAQANRILSLYWVSISFWAFWVGSQASTIEMVSPFWWGWLLHLGCIFIPALLFHSTLILTKQKSSQLFQVMKIAYGIGILFNLLNLFTLAFTNGIVYRDTYAYPKPSLIYPLYFVFFVVLVIWSTLLLIGYLPKVPDSKKMVFKLFLITQTLAYCGGMDNFLIMADIRIPPLYPFGLYVIPLYAVVTVYAICFASIGELVLEIKNTRIC